MSPTLSSILLAEPKPKRLNFLPEKAPRRRGGLFDDEDARRFRLGRGPRRADAGHGREAALEREVQVDLPRGVAAVEAELPVLGAEDVAVEAAVGISKGVLLEDARHDEILERAGIAA